MWSITTAMYLILSVFFALAAVGDAGPFGISTKALSRGTYQHIQAHNPSHLIAVRGGASVLEEESEDEYDEDVDEDEYDIEEEDEDEEEETPVVKSKLLSSTMKATEKSQIKKTATAKKAINTGLAAAETSTNALSQKKKKSKLRIPYILRAFLNPFTVFAMTKAYFASLLNLDYAKKEASQDLRSALEEKAKKAAGGGPRGKRKMKPGQSKTLSDLPQLNT